MQKLVFVVLAVLYLQSEAKRFDRCGLVRELRVQGFPEDKMRDWVCLVEYESGGVTDKISNTRKNFSQDYGLFQINSKWWCSNTGAPGKDCNVSCTDLLTEDITKASLCAKKIFKRHKFAAWNGWNSHCRTTGSLPDISAC